MRNEHLVYYSIGLQILIFHNSWIANPAEQGAALETLRNLKPASQRRCII